MNNTDKPIMRCGAGCGTSHDCVFPDCVDIKATLETLKSRESEIEELTKQLSDFQVKHDSLGVASVKLAHENMELTKQRDELKQEVLTIKRMANICGGEVDELELTMHQICIIASDALSTQEANK